MALLSILKNLNKPLKNSVFPIPLRSKLVTLLDVVCDNYIQI